MVWSLSSFYYWLIDQWLNKWIVLFMILFRQLQILWFSFKLFNIINYLPNRYDPVFIFYPFYVLMFTYKITVYSLICHKQLTKICLSRKYHWLSVFKQIICEFLLIAVYLCLIIKLYELIVTSPSLCLAIYFATNN